MFSAGGPCLIMEALSSLLEAMRITTHHCTQEQITSHFLSGQHQSKYITHESKRQEKRDSFTTVGVFSLIHNDCLLHVGIPGKRALYRQRAKPITSDSALAAHLSVWEFACVDYNILGKRWHVYWCHDKYKLLENSSHTQTHTDTQFIVYTAYLCRVAGML